MIASASLIGTLVLSVATLQALISQNSFRIQELSRQSGVLQESVGRLSLEVARLSSPGRIAKMARRQGLQLPDEVHTLPVGGDEPAATDSRGTGVAMNAAARGSP